MDATDDSRPPRRSRSRVLRCECRLRGSIVLGGKRVPLGRCWVRQSYREVLLCWAAADGGAQQREISHEMLRQLLDEGVLERMPPA